MGLVELIMTMYVVGVDSFELWFDRKKFVKTLFEAAKSFLNFRKFVCEASSPSQGVLPNHQYNSIKSCTVT